MTFGTCHSLYSLTASSLGPRISSGLRDFGSAAAWAAEMSNPAAEDCDGRMAIHFQWNVHLCDSSSLASVALPCIILRVPFLAHPCGLPKPPAFLDVGD